jgi:hypothetical protein
MENFMDELASTEFKFLKVCERFGLGSSSGVDVDEFLLATYPYQWTAEQTARKQLKILECKEIIHFSPDGTRFKLTDYGSQLFYSKKREEEDWFNQGPFIKLNPQKKEEIDIKQGEHFKGYWEVVEILKRAKRTIKIQDAYIGVETIAMLNEVQDSVDIQILTSDKHWKHKELGLVSFSKFKRQRKGRTEIKINNDVHSRRVIIDDLEVYSSDDSLKDIGLHKASKIKKLENVEEELTNYDTAWEESKDL